MGIKTNAHSRIDDINDSIEKLVQERKKITEELSKDLVNWFMKKDALKHDYDTLIGGISSILAVLESNNEDSKLQHEIWKREGLKIKKEKVVTKKVN